MSGAVSLDDRTVGKPATFGRGARANCDESAARSRAPAKLFEQARLTHPGVAADQDCRCATLGQGSQRGLESVEFDNPTDKSTAGQLLSHA